MRHVLIIWGASHLALALVLLFSSGQSPFRRDVSVDLFGLDAGTVAVVMTIALTAYDRRRVGALHLLANMGYSQRWQFTTTMVFALVAELMLQVARYPWR